MLELESVNDLYFATLEAAHDCDQDAWRDEADRRYYDALYVLLASTSW